MHIRVTDETDLEAILAVERAAFGGEDVAALTRDLLHDPSAEPILSLLALEGDKPVGHVLFTRARVGDAVTPTAILAPLAVVPKAQRRGVGSALVANGLAMLKRSGVELVLVLGHPEYYPRHGFAPAARFGYRAPYPIPDKDADAWMAMTLADGAPAVPPGQVVCATSLMRPEHWRE